MILGILFFMGLFGLRRYALKKTKPKSDVVPGTNIIRPRQWASAPKRQNDRQADENEWHVQIAASVEPARRGLQRMAPPAPDFERIDRAPGEAGAEGLGIDELTMRGRE